MVKIIYIEHSGKIHEVEAREGVSLMEVAVKHGVPGIDADCGGACACATCHVYVEPDWQDQVSPQSAIEASMLEFAEGVEPNSRLACQIQIGAGHDGLTVRLPEHQH